ncbi:MAG TPA: response regulator [Sphingomonadaceae bacterium]|nr:response regulator [Sphingomonadaceae bacterium]
MASAPDKAFDPLLYGALAAATVLPFLADMILPLGTAVWVLYIFPVVLAYLAMRPIIPPALAAVGTVLMIIGYIFGPAGVNADIAAINRLLGAFTCWIVGGIGFLFVRHRKAVRRQDWLQAGQVGIAEAISGEQGLDELGGNVLGFLTDYVGAQAGAIFIQNGESYRLRATFGVPAEAAIPDHVQPGDGLLGEALRERRAFRLDVVPDDYLYYGSGLGQAKPRHLLIQPITVEGHANAVLELGFANRPGPLRADLLASVAEVIGVAIRSTRFRLRLQELLEETQQQAEELQVQSEELRAANEELEQQARSLQDSQARLEEQQVELEQSNANLEEHMQALEAQRDDLARAQSALQAQKKELEQASRYKSEFLANMSHELRTPLNSLLIMARLLADNRHGTLSAEEVKFAETIETSGNDLLLLINDILDISKIEAGQLELQPRRVRIAPIGEKLKTAFGAAAADKGLLFTLEILPETPDDLETDPQRLEQVLKNFLSNAIKFTDTGEVRLRIGAAADGRIALSVRDSGIGIPPEEQENIFEAFRQADGTVSRKYGGTGLGLSISRELARLLGGDIIVESAVGQGSTFTLLLPPAYDAAAAQARPAPPSPPQPHTRPRAAEQAPPLPVRRSPVEDDRERLTGEGRVILVVEDDPAFASILCDLSHEMGFQCLIAETADEGVLMARQYLPNAVILDIGLPDHTGLVVLDRIKRDLRTRHIPVHVVSVSDYTQAALAYGAAGYMLKPVRREELVQVLEGLETRMAQRMRRVLVVDDDARQLEGLRHLLASRDVEAVDARTAAECLERLALETFDCMVLDLNLPDASGFEVLERLSIDESISFPPAIVYTGRALSADEELQLRKYSKSIIIKGAKSPERLLDEVTLFLHQVVSDLPEQHQQMLAKSLNRDAALEGRHILVVEDDIRNVYALTSLFESHGATIRIARNGREALTALEAARDGGQPVDLVLMDVMMPEMDGLTATKEIRRQGQWKDLPIITLTAKAMPQDHEQCIAAGASDYLAKPLDIDKLLSLVRVWMPR